MSISFAAIKKHIITRLEKELHPGLGYHNVAHTLDVLEQAEYIACKEGVKDPHDLLLLKTATVYHDAGFLFTYRGHEQKSCEILTEDLKDKFSGDDINRMCGMIMATKIPQSPNNLLEQVICDADLDYLGRDDFEPISTFLHKEFIDFKIIPPDAIWDHVQIGFFEMHHYFTPTVINSRQEKKDMHLRILKERSNWKK